MMKRSDIRSLMKDLEKKVSRDGDVTEVLQSIDKITESLAELDEEEPRIRVPYVNASSIGTGAWK